MFHLGSVLRFFADLHPDYRCRAFEEALEFYNQSNDAHIKPVEGYELHLIQYGPLDRALGHSLGRVALESIKTYKKTHGNK